MPTLLAQAWLTFGVRQRHLDNLNLQLWATLRFMVEIMAPHAQLLYYSAELDPAIFTILGHA